MLGEEAQVAANVLLEEAPAVGRTADVDDLGAGKEEHAPACPVEAIAPVGFLAEQEERAVRWADGVDRVASDEHAGAHHVLHFTRFVVVEVARVEGIERVRSRAQLAQEEVFGREPPERGEATHGPLERAVGVEQLWTDHRGLRMLVGEGGKLLDGVADGPRVGVQQQDEAA